MKQPYYKKLLSYLFDFGIESISSEYNESLDLVLSQGRYQLLTQDAIYSFEDKYDNFRLSFKQYDLDKFNIENVLLLGLGMASIPIILERTFRKKYHYTGVEIDDGVIYLASKYILDDLQSNVEIYETNALHFMHQNQAQYEMICMDVFIDDQIPDPFKNEEFLGLLKAALKPNGILFFNWLAVSNEDREKVQEYYENIFNKVFPQGEMLVLANNRMLVNQKQNKY